MAAHQAPHPWDSPGKNTGVGCHFLLQCIKVRSESEVAQSCPTLCGPHGLQPTRLLRPWDFLGKSTGMGCHCLLQLFSLPVCNKHHTHLLSVIPIPLTENHLSTLGLWSQKMAKTGNPTMHYLCPISSSVLWEDHTYFYLSQPLIGNSSVNSTLACSFS